jgi:hypothetical protein
MTARPQEREQLVVRVLPETKARLERLSVLTTKTMTELLETMAARWEKSTLTRLKDDHKQFYFDGVLRFEVAFGRKNKWKGKINSTMAQRTAAVSMSLMPENKSQLERCAKFYGIPMAVLIDRLTIHLETGFKRRRPPEQAPPQPEPPHEPLPQNAGLLEGVT